MDIANLCQIVSNCCSAKMCGELFNNIGRCADCLEMAECVKEEEN